MPHVVTRQHRVRNTRDALWWTTALFALCAVVGFAGALRAEAPPWRGTQPRDPGVPASILRAYLDVPFSAADGLRVHVRSGRVSALGRGRIARVAQGAEGAETRAVTVAHLLYENHERTLLLATRVLRDVTAAAGTDVDAKTTLGRTVRGQTWTLAWRPLGLTETFEAALEGAAPDSVPGGALEDAREKGWQRATGKAVQAALEDRRQLFVPQREKKLILVHQDSRTFQMLERGTIVARMRAGFGQVPGKKVRQGDNKTPRGMYFITSAYAGPIDGPSGPWFGERWVKLSYPNAYDAKRGVKNGWLTKAQARQMAKKWRARKLPWRGSKLGGGIGFHGWVGARDTYGDWSDMDPWQTWGCVLLHNVDIRWLYPRMTVGTMVVLM